MRTPCGRPGEGRGGKGCPHKAAAAEGEVRARRSQMKGGVTSPKAGLAAGAWGGPAGTPRKHPPVPLLRGTKPWKVSQLEGIPCIGVGP